MADLSSIPIFCDNIGIGNASALHCCYLESQNSSDCREFFNPSANTLVLSHPNSKHWIDICTNNSQLYSSKTQITLAGDGRSLYRRYNVCANLPAIASFSSQGLLNDQISSYVAPHIQRNPTDFELMNVTSNVASCLTQTCRKARNPRTCLQQCSPVRLLVNSTFSNITGLDTCLNTLCSGNDSSLPYADPDVIGIGVSLLKNLQGII